MVESLPCIRPGRCAQGRNGSRDLCGWWSLCVRKLRKRAIAIGEKPRLYRDWPVSKGCTPPFVPVWVEFMVKRNA
jgi:hypothetical protein